jgi:hypothetical protein
VLVGANRSIGLFGGTSINIESEQINMSSNQIRLGVSSAENGMQPVLKGDDTVNVLLQLTNILQGISEILKVAQIYPQGVPLPDTASLIISGQALATLEELKKLLEDQNNGIKSNFVKTI